MTKVPLLPLVALVHSINYLNLSNDGVVIGSIKNSLVLLSEHEDGDFVFAHIACRGDLPFAKYTQESLYRLRSEFTGEIPAEATIMPGAILVGTSVIALDGEPHNPVAMPHVKPGAPGAIELSGRMLVTASHICQTFQVESARFITPIFFTVRGAAFSLAVRGERIG